jgi:hypothetical protein
VADALPMTFVDYAELIWRKLEDLTQQEVAGELGWSREGVKNYWSLYKICKLPGKLLVRVFRMARWFGKMLPYRKMVEAAPGPGVSA